MLRVWGVGGGLGLFELSQALIQASANGRLEIARLLSEAGALRTISAAAH